MRCSFLPVSGFNVPISNGRRSDREKYIAYSCSLLVQKQLSFGDAHVVVEGASDSVIPIISVCGAGHLLGGAD